MDPRYDLRLERRLHRVFDSGQALLPDDDRLLGRDTMARYAHLLPNATSLTIAGDDAPAGTLVIVQEPAKLVEARASLAGENR